MPSEFAPPGGKPRVTKKQIKQMQENYKKAWELLEDTTAEEAQEKAILDELFEAEFDAVFEESQKVWVYIGRFQPLHKGHENILKQMREENDKVLVYIGTWWGEEEENPFSYETCESFFSEYVSADFLVQELEDTSDDQQWVENLSVFIDNHTIANTEISFYWGDLQNDYAITVIQQYISYYIETPISYREVSREEFLISVNGDNIALSGTICRDAIHREDWDFLEQCIHIKNLQIIKKKYD